MNGTATFNKCICNLTPEVRDILKILWKREEIAPQEQFLLFSTIFCYLLLDFHVGIETVPRQDSSPTRLLETAPRQIRRQFPDTF